MSNNGKVHVHKPVNLKAWKSRKLRLRRTLWDLLIAGPVDSPKRCKAKVIARDKDARQILQANRKRFFKALPHMKDAHSHLTYEWDGPVTWETSIISYPGWPGQPAQRAVLRVPCDLSEPAAVVMCFHGHMPGCLMGKEEMDYLALPLTARGYITLCPDATCWGDRRDTTYEKAEVNDWAGMSFYSERNLAMPLMLRGQTLAGVITWEHMRAVDMLCSMKKVDAKRIGCIGMSMGGMQSFWLSAMDDRIACGVEACGVCSYEVWARQRTLNALVTFIPHILRHTDTGEIGSLIAPRPYLCLDAANDIFFPVSGIRPIGRSMRSVYKLFDAKERFKQLIHQGEHVFTDDHIVLANRWLDRWLNIERAK